MLLIEDPDACGIGQKEHCCAYLVMGPDGFFCGRETELRDIIFTRATAGLMSAKRLPISPFPECQTES
jgi:hypothetical protein